jgi:hypothetical protein
MRRRSAQLGDVPQRRYISGIGHTRAGPGAAATETAPRMPLQPSASRSARPPRRAHLSTADENVTTTGSSDYGGASSP